MILHGDSIKELDKIEQNSIDLIYLDPPFFTQKTQKLKTKDNTKEYSFEDTWDNILEYKNYIQKRLKKCRDTLKNTGSIFLHCDRSASHYLRIALDEVFGTDKAKLFELIILLFIVIGLIGWFYCIIFVIFLKIKFFAEKKSNNFVSF